MSDNGAGPGRTESLSGWGRYPRIDCHVERPTSLDAVHRVLEVNPGEPLIARGLGRSYGDSALLASGVVSQMSHFNRMLAFDEGTGVLRCEAGVSLADIIEVFLPRGWGLPTTPGTKFVTVGGAIAADVHGKNHHVDGSFGTFVEELGLLTATGEVLRCSPTQHSDVFWATVGGMGLTGIIMDAQIRLRPVSSAFYDLTVKRTRDLADTLALFDEYDRQYRYSLAWVDCLASRGSLGRSVIMLASELPAADLPEKLRHNPLRIRPPGMLGVPIDPPFSLIGQWSVRAFNAAYYRTHGDSRSVVDYETLFYPLDRVGKWNRAYGRKGFIQYQALFPRAQSQEGLAALLGELSRAKSASFLAVLKASGPPSAGLLSFPYEGHTLAVDIPYSSSIHDLVERLDQVVLRFGGRVYLAKDAVTSAAAFSAMYPGVDRFREIKRLIDPNNRFVSAQSLRLGITDAHE